MNNLKQTVEKWDKQVLEADRQHIINYLEDIEERIKAYLWL